MVLNFSETDEEADKEGREADITKIRWSSEMNGSVAHYGFLLRAAIG